MKSRKTDYELGLEVHKTLLELGTENPFHGEQLEKGKKMVLIKNNFENIIGALGLDTKDASLEGTPSRVARAYVDELFYGLDYRNFPKVMTQPYDNSKREKGFVLERGVVVTSTCEHHFLPFTGSAYVAYLPKDKIIGLSKINRIVEFFSRRPQVQERLTDQIAETMKYVLDTDSVAVVVKASHMCVVCRGVEQHGADMVTSHLTGVFMDKPEARAEFFKLINI